MRVEQIQRLERQPVVGQQRVRAAHADVGERKQLRIEELINVAHVHQKVVAQFQRQLVDLLLVALLALLRPHLHVHVHLRQSRGA